jgi:hypothetical protein
MSYGCQLHKGIVYLPTAQQAEVGYYISVDPVAMIKVGATAELRQSIGEMLVKDIPIVPTPPRDAKLNNILEAAKLRSWQAFDREAEKWRIIQHQGIWKIAIQRSRKDGGGDDKSQLILFPEGTGVEEVADRLLESIQGKARALGQL